MGRFREHQKIRGEYEASADALGESFTRSLGYTAEAELEAHLRHLAGRPLGLRGREPSGFEIAEISDAINQQGVLPPPA